MFVTSVSRDPIGKSHFETCRLTVLSMRVSRANGWRGKQVEAIPKAVRIYKRATQNRASVQGGS